MNMFRRSARTEIEAVAMDLGLSRGIGTRDHGLDFLLICSRAVSLGVLSHDSQTTYRSLKAGHDGISESSTAFCKVSTTIGNGWSVTSSVKQNPESLQAVRLASKPHRSRSTKALAPTKKRLMPRGRRRAPTDLTLAALTRPPDPHGLRVPLR